MNERRAADSQSDRAPQTPTAHTNEDLIVMSEVDARVLYLNSRERYTQARKAVAALQTLIEPVARTLEHSPVRLVQNSDAGLPSWEKPMSLAHWPAAEAIIAAATELDAAFKECKALWEKIPAERRGGMDQPPSRHGAL